MKLEESRRYLVDLVAGKKSVLDFVALSGVYADSKDKTTLLNEHKDNSIDNIFGELLGAYTSQQDSFFSRRSHKNEYILHTKLLWFFSTTDPTIKQALAKQIDINQYNLPKPVVMTYLKQSSEASLSQWLVSLRSNPETLTSESLKTRLDGEFSALQAHPDYQAALKILSYVEHLEALPKLPALLREKKSQRKQMLLLHTDRRKPGPLAVSSSHDVVESVRTQLETLYHQRCDATFNALAFYNDNFELLHQARDFLLLSPEDFLIKFRQCSSGLGSTIEDQHFSYAMARLTKGLQQSPSKASSLIADFILDVIQIDNIKSHASCDRGLVHKSERKNIQDFVEYAFSSGELATIKQLSQYSSKTSLNAGWYVGEIDDAIKIRWNGAIDAISRETVLDIDVDVMCEELTNYSANQLALAQHYRYITSDKVVTNYSDDYKRFHVVALGEKLSQVVDQDFNPDQLQTMSQPDALNFQDRFNKFFTQYQDKFSQYPQLMEKLLSIKGEIKNQVEFKTDNFNSMQEALQAVKKQLSELVDADRLGWSLNPFSLFSKMPQGIRELKALLDPISSDQLAELPEEQVSELYASVEKIVSERIAINPILSCLAKPLGRNGQVHALYEKAQEKLAI